MGGSFHTTYTKKDIKFYVVYTGEHSYGRLDGRLAVVAEDKLHYRLLQGGWHAKSVFNKLEFKTYKKKI